MAATIWSTEAEFDASTKSNTVSNEGFLRFGTGGDFSNLTGWTVDTNSIMARNPGFAIGGARSAISAASLNGGSITDGTIRGRFLLSDEADSNRSGIAGRYTSTNNTYQLYIRGSWYGGALILEKVVSGGVTSLGSVVRAYADGEAVNLRLVFSGTTIRGYDDTNALDTGAVTDSAFASGGVAIWLYSDGAVCTSIRKESTALTGSASLPTSTTYTDLGAAKLMGSASWEEDLSAGGDVTVDVYGSDNGTSDASSSTGHTDPAGSDCSAAGSHRYWRVVVNFTRTLTTQEPTVGRVALNQTAAAGGGSLIIGGTVVR